MTRFAILFGPMCLSFRKDLSPSTAYDDPRGLTGSDYGCLRIAEELSAMGHEVCLHTVSNDSAHGAIAIKPLDAPIESDVVIAINEPDLLRAAPAGSKRVLWCCLNDFSFCRVGFEEHVDLFLSPSAAHLEQVMTNPAWREVERTAEFPNGRAQFTPDASRWVVMPLGCDPEMFFPLCDLCHGHGYEDGMICEKCGNVGTVVAEKIPGRVIYASSPDRGLHHLLSSWPTIKAAVPHATLHVFYRLEPFLRGFDQTPWFPPIEPNRKRANYIEECLRRFQEHGGMGVTLRDSVSRRTIEREMAQAEVLAYPCDTIVWSEGFSCTTLEACAARACPVVSGCDAMGEIYAELEPVKREPGWVKAWTARVIEALTTPAVREEQNERAYHLASKLTWKNYAANLMKEIETRWPPVHPSPSPSEPVAESSSTSSKSSTGKRRKR